jgi:hypothetical protein
MSLSSVRSETALRSRLFSSSRSFKALHLFGLQPTELLAPPIIRHLAHADLADCVHHILALLGKPAAVQVGALGNVAPIHNQSATLGTST